MPNLLGLLLDEVVDGLYLGLVDPGRPLDIPNQLVVFFDDLDGWWVQSGCKQRVELVEGVVCLLRDLLLLVWILFILLFLDSLPFQSLDGFLEVVIAIEVVQRDCVILPGVDAGLIRLVHQGCPSLKSRLGLHRRNEAGLLELVRVLGLILHQLVEMLIDDGHVGCEVVLICADHFEEGLEAAIDGTTEDLLEHDLALDVQAVLFQYHRVQVRQQLPQVVNLGFFLLVAGLDASREER